jgi:hypothetical protein
MSVEDDARTFTIEEIAHEDTKRAPSDETRVREELAWKGRHGWEGAGR